MNVNVFMRLGKEINEHTKNAITQEFESKNLEINDAKPDGQDQVGFIIRNKVADMGQFVKNVYKTLQHVPRLYLVAPQKALDKIKHHPRVHCFDSKLIDDPSKGASDLINYAYHGRQV